MTKVPCWRKSKKDVHVGGSEQLRNLVTRDDLQVHSSRHRHHQRPRHDARQSAEHYKAGFKDNSLVNCDARIDTLDRIKSRVRVKTQDDDHDDHTAANCPLVLVSRQKWRRREKGGQGARCKNEIILEVLRQMTPLRFMHST